MPTDSLRPHAPGTLDSCATYENAVNMPAMEEAFGYMPWFAEANTCSSFAGKYEISIEELMEWNPSLSENGCVFEQEYSYCVLKKQTITTSAPLPPSSTTSTDKTSSTTSVDMPENTQPGTIKTCKKFHRVGEDDGACDGIIAMYELKRDDFYDWNPDVVEHCTTLWLGYYVCVGV